MNHRAALQQQANPFSRDQFTQYFLHFRGHLLQQFLAGGLLRFLQLAGYVLKIRLLTGQFFASGYLLLLAHYRGVFLEFLDDFIKLTF